jgi:hypothetical protein
MNAFHSTIAAATTVDDLEVVQGAIGSSYLMEFVRFDAGEVLRKERNGQGPQILRLVVGNSLSLDLRRLDTLREACAELGFELVVAAERCHFCGARLATTEHYPCCGAICAIDAEHS